MNIFLAKYGTSVNIEGIPLLDSDGNFLTGLTFAAGDVKVAKNGGSPANITTLITENPASSKNHRIALSATEMQAAIVVVNIIDQTEPKEWVDQRITVLTYGHSSAWLKVDLGDSVRMGLTALPNVAAGAEGGLPNATNSNGQVVASSVAGDVEGKVLGGGDGEIEGIGAEVRLMEVDGDTQEEMSEAIDTWMTNTHGSGSWQQSGISGNISAFGVPINADLTGGTSTQFEARFDADGWDASDWTEYAWTLKADPDNDTDEEALLVVKVSNPGDEGDGLQVINRSPATDATMASLSVDVVDTETLQVSLVLTADAMQIPPSPSGKSYKWELDEWKGGAKRRVGYGNFKVERTVLRGTATP